MRHYIIILFACACAVACTQKKPSADEMGQMMLTEARAAYERGEYAAARDSIMSLRTNYPTAITARREAILLLDSVEFQLAQDDTLKSEFYRRKLQHDLEKLKIEN